MRGSSKGKMRKTTNLFHCRQAPPEKNGFSGQRWWIMLLAPVLLATLFHSPLLAAGGEIKIPEGVELFENEGQDHVEDGVHIFYKTDPPTSGTHAGRWLPASVYGLGEAKTELLVHNLEHGNIVIYFDRSVLSKSDLKPLFTLAKKHIGQWDGILLVERNDKEHPMILTAWRAMLRLSKVDMKRISSFVDTFRGRGPENRVR